MVGGSCAGRVPVVRVPGVATAALGVGPSRKRSEPAGHVIYTCPAHAAMPFWAVPGRGQPSRFGQRPGPPFFFLATKKKKKRKKKKYSSFFQAAASSSSNLFLLSLFPPRLSKACLLQFCSLLLFLSAKPPSLFYFFFLLFAVHSPSPPCSRPLDTFNTASQLRTSGEAPCFRTQTPADLRRAAAATTPRPQSRSTPLFQGPNNSTTRTSCLHPT